MKALASIIPFIIFISTFFGFGLYFTATGRNDAFYIVSPIIAIVPAFIVAWFINRNAAKEKIDAIIEGMRHKDIVTMCLIFLLAGAFSNVTSKIGSVIAVVNLVIDVLPTEFIIVGIFLASAIISTAIGTSMGTIATVAPIAVGIASASASADMAIYLGAVIGGAMFGDNLAIASDTTIAAIISQDADPQKKFKFNGLIACISASITLIVMMIMVDIKSLSLAQSEYSLLLITPYVLLLLMMLIGANMFVAIFVCIIYSGIIGIVQSDYSFTAFGNDFVQGFFGMQEIMLLSLLVGGLFGLSDNPSSKIANQLISLLDKRKNQNRAGQLAIAGIAATSDILIGNNTIAIICTGDITRNIAKKCNIPSYKAAAWVDIFSCIAQGLIPYGAQVLLACKLGNVSTLDVVPKIYYCYVLGAVSLTWIYVSSRKQKGVISNIQASVIAQEEGL